RPCNSDYLPLSQGDSGFFQPDGFASFAGQTKKPEQKRSGFYLSDLNPELRCRLRTFVMQF
ncbi:hypothetical protein, partial [Vibrio vulnificus]